MRRRCLLPFAGLFAAVLSAAGQDAPSLLRQLDAGFSEVFAKAAPSVLVIEASRSEEESGASPYDFFSRDDQPAVPDRRRDKNWTLPEPAVRSEGCGFLVRPEGYVLTNRHVVSGAERVEVRSYEGRRWSATVVATDERTDVAVLKIEAASPPGLPTVTWGDSDALRVGQLVCAIGAPFNQEFSFTCGWVSGKGRSNLLAPNGGRPVFEDYIQTDAFINPGNSGGPLLDVDGRVIGMNTLINGLGRGLAFAIPANLLRDVADQLIETGRVRRPWLGVRVTSLERSRALQAQFPGIEHGVVVNTIEAGGPAAGSDLQPGDLITAINGTALRSSHDLVRFVQRRKVGDPLELAVIRRGKTFAVSVATGEQTDDTTRVATGRPPVPAPLPPIKPGLGLTLGLGKAREVVVTEILPRTPADRADLRVGDRITSVGTEAVEQPEAALAAIEKAVREQPDKGALLQFLRDGKKCWAVIERPAP